MTTIATETHTAQAQGPAVLRPREVRALLRAPDRRARRGRRDSALLAALVGSGARVGELVRLTRDQVEHGPGGRVRLMLRTSKGRNGTPPRFRTVTLPAPMARLLREYVAREEPRWWLFEGRRNEALSVRQAQKIVMRWLREIGRGDLRVHSLRHSFGAMVTRETRSIFVAQKLLGHADPRTTARYYAAFEVSDADAAADAVAEALSRRGRRAA